MPDYPVAPGALIQRFDAPQVGNGQHRADEIIDANPDYLTVDEIDQAEEMLGGPIDNMGKMARRGPAIRVIATIIKRRTDPTFPYELAGTLRIRFSESKQEVPPTNGNGSEPSQPLPNSTE